MLDFFNRNKKNITTSFPDNYVDIHSHILPNIDDGSKSIEESIALLKRMQSYGIVNFIFTPHVIEDVWTNSSNDILKKLDEFKEVLHKNNINNLNVKVAAEYMLDSNFSALLKNKDLLTFNDNYLLVEISYVNPPINLYNLIFEIQLAGYQPILAHPERYIYYHSNFKEYIKLKNAGCKFQLNLLSLAKYYGDSVHSIALKLLKENMIDFTGSDTHNIRHLDYLKKINNRKTLELIKPIMKNNSILF